MGTQSAVGGSRSHASFEAGRDAASAALRDLGTGAEPMLAIVFASGAHDHDELIEGVRSVTGGAEVIGCSGAGVLTRGAADESSHVVAVMLVRSTVLRVATAVADGLSKDPVGCAAKIAAAAPADAKVLLLFPDGLTGNTSALVRALGERLPNVMIVGGGAGGELDLETTNQYLGGTVHHDAVVGAYLGGAIEIECGVTHGCELVGIEHVVTRAEGGFVAELDGRPAWELMREYLDDPSMEFSAPSIAYLCVAQKLPDHGDAKYGQHVIRVPLGKNDEGGLFFPGELPVGERITMARRAREVVVDRAVDSIREVRDKRKGQKPAFVLQFECTGRGKLLFGDTATETLLAPVQNEIPDVPWIGYHAFGEIAPIGGRPYYHNYTQALCAVYDAEGEGSVR